MTYVVISLVASDPVHRRPRPLLYAATGTVNMADLAGRIGATCRQGAAARFAVLLLVVFGIKAGRVPAVLLAARQLPDGAVAGDCGVRRPAHQGRRLRAGPLPDPAVPRQTAGRDRCCSCSPGSPWSSGVLGAIAQNDLKRILSFHIVSQIGYMVMGLAPVHASPAWPRAIFFLVHQIVVKTTPVPDREG